MVAYRGERDDLFKLQLVERKGDCRLGGLGGVASIPMWVCQPPADLDAGRKMRREGWHIQPHKADEVCHALDLNRPQAKPVAIEMLRDLNGPLIAFLAGQHLREKLHHARV